MSEIAGLILNQVSFRDLTILELQNHTDNSTPVSKMMALFIHVKIPLKSSFYGTRLPGLAKQSKRHC